MNRAAKAGSAVPLSARHNILVGGPRRRLDSGGLAIAAMLLAPCLSFGTTVTLPAVASLPPGTAAAPFFSDVRALNTSHTASLSVTAVYRCFLGTCPASAPQTSFVLTPRESRVFDDMILRTFSAPGTAGAVEFSFSGDAGSLRVTSRLYSTSPNPTVGMFIPGLESEAAHPVTVLMSLANGLSQNGEARANVGLFNPTDVTATATVKLYDGATLLGTLPPVTLAAHSGTQVNNVFAAVGQGSLATTNGVAVVETDPRSRLPLFTYAATIFRPTEDPIFVVGARDEPRPQPDGASVTLPAAASLPPGTAAAPFFSDVRVFNSSKTASLSVTAVYRCFLGACPAAAPQTTFALGPRESQAFDDMVLRTFASPGTAGAVEFTGNGVAGTLRVTSRLYSTAPNPTVGMFIPGLESEAAHPLTVLTSLANGPSQNGEARANVGLFNPQDIPVVAGLKLYDGATLLGTLPPVTLAPHSGTQINNVFAAVGQAARVTTNGVCVIETDRTTRLPLLTYAATIFRPTEDPIFVVGARDAFAPSSQELIQAARTAGRIDRGTALLYRGYAVVGDPRLPEEFRGSGSLEEDLGFFFEAQDAMSSLPSEVQVQLRRFLVRPTHPDSIFNAPPGPSAHGANAAACPGNMSSLGWTSERSPTHPFRVWIRCTGDPAIDLTANLQVAATLQVMEKVWTTMTNLMGEPLIDAGGPDEGGDTAIDIYIVGFLDDPTRGESRLGIRDSSLGYAYITPPSTGARSSGYIVMSRGQVGAGIWRSLLVHEFFHVLQFAHSWALLVGEIWWYVEASATWASAYVDLVLPWDRREAYYEPHYRFQHEFQPSRESLHVSQPTRHTYAAYIWPFFVYQELGAEAIGASWRALEPVTTFDQALDVLDAQLPFRQNFHRFAVENLNDWPTLEKAGLRRYVERDKVFPHTVPPRHAEFLIPNKPEPQLPVRLAALGADYYYYGAGDPDIKQVTVDFSMLVPQEGLDVDALVNFEDRGWEYRNLTGRGKVRFCFDREEDKFIDLQLILSNHFKRFDEVITGDLQVRALSEPCTCAVTSIPAWTGTLSYSYAHVSSSMGFQYEAHHSADVSFRLEPEAGHLAWRGLPTGTATIDDTITISLTDPPKVSTIRGSGEPITEGPGGADSRVFLAIDPNTCTYVFSFTPHIDAIASGPDGSVQIRVNIGSVRSGKHSVPGSAPFTLSGSAHFPGHTTQWALENEGDAYIPTGLASSSDASLGFATVIWSFTSELPPGTSAEIAEAAPTRTKSRKKTEKARTPRH